MHVVSQLVSSDPAIRAIVIRTRIRPASVKPQLRTERGLPNNQPYTQHTAILKAPQPPDKDCVALASRRTCLTEGHYWPVGSLWPARQLPGLQSAFVCSATRHGRKMLGLCSRVASRGMVRAVRCM